MNWVSNIIISSGAVALLSTGTYLALQDQPAIAGTVLGFAFLLVVLLLVAKFKRIKGFGFEAEMWDEKQVQAAVLVDKLTALATLTSEQVALISSKLGLWDSGLTNPQLLALIGQADAVLQACDMPKPRRDEILSPIRDRIGLNYWGVARHIADAGFRVEIETLHGKLRHAAEPERSTLTNEVQKFDEERRKLNGLQYDKLNPTIATFLGLVKANLADHKQLLDELGELDADMIAFRQAGELRRAIDISPLYKQNVW